MPVKAYTAVRDHDVHFHQLDKKSGARIRNEKVAGEVAARRSTPTTSRWASRSATGRYVTFDKDELDELRPRSTKAIEVTDFVALDDIDPIYYERTYWLAPDGDAAKQAVPAAAGGDGGPASGSASARVVMRNKQYLAAIRPLDGVLAMSTMRFADEVVPRAEIDELPSARGQARRQGAAHGRRS